MVVATFRHGIRVLVAGFRILTGLRLRLLLRRLFMGVGGGISERAVAVDGDTAVSPATAAAGAAGAAGAASAATAPSAAGAAGAANDTVLDTAGIED